jgi:hypothetical protein
MEKRDLIIENVKAVIAAPSCCPELKEVAQNYLKALNTVAEKEAAKKLVAELEEDVLSIDVVLAFASSPVGAKVFGEEKATAFAAQAKKVKADGGKYCFCPACTAGKKVLDMKDVLL